MHMYFHSQGRPRIEAPRGKLRGIIPRKVFCLIFDSLANPAAPLSGISASLRQATGNALAVAVRARRPTYFFF